MNNLCKNLVNTIYYFETQTEDTVYSTDFNSQLFFFVIHILRTFRPFLKLLLRNADMQSYQPHKTFINTDCLTSMSNLINQVCHLDNKPLRLSLPFRIIFAFHKSISLNLSSSSTSIQAVFVVR